VTHGSPGNPFTHQRDFARGLVLCDVPRKGVLRVSGPDRLTWLNSLISQDVLTLTPEDTQEGLILDPHGHIEHAFLLTDDGSNTWLLTEETHVESLVTWLLSMRFRMQVEVSPQERPYVLVAVFGPQDSVARTALSAIGSPLVAWDDPWPRIQPGSLGYSPHATPEDHPGAGWSLRYELHPAGTVTAVRALGPVDAGVIEGLAIAAGRPALADTDAKALPHEFDWLRTAVHLNKGCYRGQETVAKVHNLGHPPRRLTLLHIDGSQSLLPAAKDTVMVGEREVGVVTRAAWHYELGPIALALLKRNLDPAETLTIHTTEGPLPANQEILVSPDAGATRRVPRIPRLGSTTS
jgi:folate-binding protein YgfZ